MLDKIKKKLGRDKKSIQKTILALIVLIWVYTFAVKGDYLFWAGDAGIMTIPLLLLSLFLDLW